MTDQVKFSYLQRCDLSLFIKNVPDHRKELATLLKNTYIFEYN